LAGIIGGFATMNSVREWYPTLKKPMFTPPSWVFGPAWTILFTLMGIALYLIWRRWKTCQIPAWKLSSTYLTAADIGVVLFFAQLTLNAFWSIIFFGFCSPGAAMIEIIALWVFILMTTIYFFKVSKIAGVLLLPYLLWSSFAAVLNFAIWLMNSRFVIFTIKI
jgi:translocator protein